jgi:uncharacterized membrane protein
MAELWARSPDPNHPSLYFLLLRWSLGVFGLSEAAARVPSAIAATCNLLLVVVLARRLRLGARAPWMAAALLALAPIDLWYSQEARMYEAVTTAGLLFAITLTFDSWIGAALTWAALTIAFYLDFTMAPLACGLLALWWADWRLHGSAPGRLLRTALAAAAAWLCFKPYWPLLWQIVSHVNHVPLFDNLRYWLGLRVSPGLPLLGVLAAITVGIAFASSRLAARAQAPDARRRWRPAILGVFLALTVLMAVPRAYSVKQYLLTGWPYVILAVAWALDEGDGLAGLSLTLAVSLLAGVVTIATPRADWRGVSAYLHAHPPRGGTWLDPAFNEAPYRYYRPSVPPVLEPVAHGESPALYRALAEGVCLVAARTGKTPPTSPTEAWLNAHGRVSAAVPFTRLEVRCYDAAR